MIMARFCRNSAHGTALRFWKSVPVSVCEKSRALADVRQRDQLSTCTEELPYAAAWSILRAMDTALRSKNSRAMSCQSCSRSCTECITPASVLESKSSCEESSRSNADEGSGSLGGDKWPRGDSRDVGDSGGDTGCPMSRPEGMEALTEGRAKELEAEAGVAEMALLEEAEEEDKI